MISDFLRSRSFADYKLGKVEKYFIDHHAGNARGRYFFEAGAVNGFHLSNTASLEKEWGWDGILVEGHFELFSELEKSERSAHCVPAVLGDGSLHWFEQKSEGLLGHSQIRSQSINDDCYYASTQTVEAILTEMNAPTVIDLMVIDVEGGFRPVWEGIDFASREIDFLALEMHTPDYEIIDSMTTEHGYRLETVLGNDDFIFTRNR